MITEIVSPIDLLATFPDEQTCLDHLKVIQWRDGEFAPIVGITEFIISVIVRLLSAEGAVSDFQLR